MPFNLCNAPATFQRCMLAIFHDMIEESVEIFMDDFSVFGNSFDNYLNNLNKMLQPCKDANLVLKWEKSHFIVKEGIMLGHKVFGACLEVDKAKINIISKLPPPTNVKGIRSFLGHAGFYRRFIKDFSKIARPLTKFLEKDTPFEFNDECHKAFNSLKEKFTCTPVIVSPNWNLPFELMCDASEFAVGAVLGQKDGKHFHPIYFASKTLNAAHQKYTVTEKELTAIILLLQESDSEIKYKKGTENVTADHLSRIENNETSNDNDVDDNFSGETLMEITTRDIPWFADFANYLVDSMIRHYVTGPETHAILDQCHHRPTGGHYGPTNTAKKDLDSGFYWPTIIKEAHTLVRTMAGVDVNTLTMEQYLALLRENQAPGMVNPEIGGNVNIEIKSQFMCELREDTFSGNKNEDAHDHIDQFLSIVSLFNIPGVSKDAVMLRVFPFTITGATKRWVDILAPGTINTWDLLKKAFIQRYCPPSNTAKQLEDVHNFKEEKD
ncbi:reverse transcriptase domain-containing protein [Tanacetum coccineum]